MIEPFHHRELAGRFSRIGSSTRVLQEEKSSRVEYRALSNFCNPANVLRSPHVGSAERNFRRDVETEAQIYRRPDRTDIHASCRCRTILLGSVFSWNTYRTAARKTICRRIATTCPCSSDFNGRAGRLRNCSCYIPQASSTATRSRGTFC